MPRQFKVVGELIKAEGHAVMITNWDPRVCTTDYADTFCGNHEFMERRGAMKVYRCKGHEVLGPEGGLDGPDLGAPRAIVERDPRPHRPGYFDYYEVYPARGVIVRVHLEWRAADWNPHDLPGSYTEGDLVKKRVVEKEFATGGNDLVEEEWGGTPRPYLDASGVRDRKSVV